VRVVVFLWYVMYSVGASTYDPIFFYEYTLDTWLELVGSVGQTHVVIIDPSICLTLRDAMYSSSIKIVFLL
jgi:hypothetical protein